MAAGHDHGAELPVLRRAHGQRGLALRLELLAELGDLLLRVGLERRGALAEVGDPDAEVIERLRALGYID